MDCLSHRTTEFVDENCSINFIKYELIVLTLIISQSYFIQNRISAERLGLNSFYLLGKVSIQVNLRP
jgi:hypothetical protein